MYEDYLKYVKDYLTTHNGDFPPNPLMAFRSKYQHTVRVLGWAKRLAEGRLLMEADLLDEEGALRMVWYTLDKCISGTQSYEDVYEHIVMGNNKRLVNPMVTEKAKHYWNEKHKLVEVFTKQLKDDITVSI